MVEFFISWHAALVFLAALASPGWGAATAGLFIGIDADSWTLPLWAAVGGCLRDAALYAWTAAGHWALIRLPKSIQTQLHQAPVATAVGLQSFHLFRWDLAAAAGAGGQPRLRFLAWLTVASAICAYLGAVAAWGLFILLCPGGLGLFEARQSLPGLILLALLAAETLRIVLERLIERFGNPS